MPKYRRKYTIVLVLQDAQNYIAKKTYSVAQVRIDDVNPTPNSHNPKYMEGKLENIEIPYEETCEKWLNKKA